MAWRWLQRRRASESSDRPIAEECEAYLSGHFAELAEAEPAHPPFWAELGQVPFWAWLNPLAHDSEDELVRLAASRPEPNGQRRELALTADLAFQVLAAARRSSVPVAVVQATTLAPLEQQMIRFPFGWTSGSPALLERLVPQALERDFPALTGRCRLPGQRG